MIRCAVSQSHESSPEINMMMLNRLIRGMPTWAWIAATGVLLASDSCNAFTGGVELHASAAGRVFSPFAGAWHTGSQRSVGPIGGRANLVMGLQTKKKVGRKTGMAASRSTKARVQADDFAAVSTGASSGEKSPPPQLRRRGVLETFKDLMRKNLHARGCRAEDPTTSTMILP